MLSQRHFRLVLLLLPPAAGALTAQFLMSDGAGGWTMRGLLPGDDGGAWVAVRFLPGYVLAALVAFHLAVVLPAAWFAFGAGDGRLGARVAAATTVIGGAMLAVAALLSAPGTPLWATLLMAAIYGGIPAAVLWGAAAAVGPYAVSDR